eukprot:CAMPEP_0114447152 /NCGR_PEP_ID=MMETSP0103-20121206/19626_1 /TAXON_ID=37642 ORGANISM="Paraphysomonas imperforata, Strain PA2" /NCGR_SAMPLE_ID=MMETSP0103 /ASSEMBLY_ACC=CAM_ASM_000201 /LENGTH=78 /DNA_ID=CAMNT_0001619055 /DNA_START=332 /DNA_END=568 /DNA_ORIENTATION=-
MSAVDLARLIDSNHNQVLSVDEIILYLCSPDMQQQVSNSTVVMPSPEELSLLKGPLLLVADKGMDGHITFEEFAEFLS